MNSKTAQNNVKKTFLLNCFYFCTDIDDCDPDPCVNGDCTDGVNTYTCDCDDGYTGTNCDQSNDNWLTV